MWDSVLKVVRGIVKLRGGTDNTVIGNVSDRLKVDSFPSDVGGQSRFGDVSTAVIAQAVVRRTTYTEQTTNAQRSVVSSSVLDAAAGTGGRQVKITYYTATLTGPFTETVTLNGITAVNTVATNICFIEKMDIISVGSTNANQGTISLKAAAAGLGATIGTIGATDNQTFWAHHYVATGMTCNITDADVNHNGTTAGSGGYFILKSDDPTSATAVEVQISIGLRLYGQSSSVIKQFGAPVDIAGPARISMYLTPETGALVTYRGEFEFYDDVT